MQVSLHTLWREEFGGREFREDTRFTDQIEIVVFAQALEMQTDLHAEFRVGILEEASLAVMDEIERKVLIRKQQDQDGVQGKYKRWFELQLEQNGRDLPCAQPNEQRGRTGRHHQPRVGWRTEGQHTAKHNNGPEPHLQNKISFFKEFDDREQKPDQEEGRANRRQIWAVEVQEITARFLREKDQRGNRELLEQHLNCRLASLRHLSAQPAVEEDPLLPDARHKMFRVPDKKHSNGVDGNQQPSQIRPQLPQICFQEIPLPEGNISQRGNGKRKHQSGTDIKIKGKAGSDPR